MGYWFVEMLVEALMSQQSPVKPSSTVYSNPLNKVEPLDPEILSNIQDADIQDNVSEMSPTLKALSQSEEKKWASRKYAAG